MTKQEIENGTVTLTNGITKTLTEYLKDTSNYLINKLENYNDAFSQELKTTLKNSLGKKWSKVVEAIENIKIEPKEYFHTYYDLSFNIALSEILYPDINEFENVKP